jgi:predicted dehydrogenase
MAQVNWEVIGAGGTAMRRTLPGAVGSAPSARFMALTVVRTEAARRVPEQFGVPAVCTGEAELLADASVQTVYVATPVVEHVRQVVAAAESSKHMFAKKPVYSLSPRRNE